MGLYNGGMLAFTGGPISRAITAPNGTGLQSASGNGKIFTDDSTGTEIAYGSNTLIVNSSLFNLTGNYADGASLILFNVANGVVMTTNGATMMRLANGVGVGNLRLGCVTKVQNNFCYAEDLTCSGTVTAGDVVVWAGSDSKTVARAAASPNLTTIAGVAITGGVSQTITVARSGRCYVTADATGAPAYTVGQLCGTSGNTPGAVQGTGNTGFANPGAGAILGRILEARGASVAGMVNIDLVLG